MIEYLLIIVGFVLLIKGADFLVEGASSLSKKLGVSTLIIGLTVVAFGTSMPELFVNIFAAVKGANDIALGNIIGSNIANILLVLGITALIYPVKIHKATIWKEIPLGILAALVLLVIANDRIIDGVTSQVSRTDGIMMLFFLAIFVYYIYEAAKSREVKIKKEIIEIKTKKFSTMFFSIIAGVVFLGVGGKFVVDNAIIIASNLGISQYLISALVLAIGTSLPELVTSITAGIKKDLDLAVGNIVGSNIFNIFWILGITASISPISVPKLVNFDIIFLIISSALLFLFVLGKRLGKKRGFVLLALYLIYILFLLIRG